MNDPDRNQQREDHEILGALERRIRRLTVAVVLMALNYYRPL